MLGRVDLAYIGSGAQEPAVSLGEDPRIRLHRLIASRGVHRLRAYVRARRMGVPAAFARGVSPELLESRGLLDAGRYERIVADGPTAAAALILLDHLEQVVYNAHNLESELRPKLDGFRREFGSTELLRRFEQGLFERSVETWLPSTRDITGARVFAPTARLRLIPNVIDVGAVAPVSRSGERRLVFVADFTYEPNRNGLRFLLRDVMPRVHEREPRARVAIVGRGVGRSEASRPGVESGDCLDSVQPAYEASDCAVVPLLENSGSPLKLIEGMAYGLPVVSTSVAGRGLGAARPGVHYLEADMPSNSRMRSSGCSRRKGGTSG